MSIEAIDPISSVQSVGLIPADTHRVSSIVPTKNGEGEELHTSLEVTDSNGNVLSISNSVLQLYTYQAKHLHIHPQSRGTLV